MNSEDYTAKMQYIIGNNIPIKEAASILGCCERTAYRRKKDFIATGRTEYKRSCHIPYNEEECVILFTELTFKSDTEKMVKAIERVCDKIGKIFDTERKKVNILSYPSLYYISKSNEIIVPVKSEVGFGGGIAMRIDEEMNDVVVDYADKVGNEEEIVDGRNDENYLRLIDFVIKIMSTTYFQNVKDRPKEYKTPNEKFESYYKKFKSFIQTPQQEDELKDIIYILIKQYNNYIYPLISNNNGNIINDENDDVVGYCNSIPDSLYNPPRSYEDISNNNDLLSLSLPPLPPYSESSSLLLPSPLSSPLPSPLVSPRGCRSRERSRAPLLRSYNEYFNNEVMEDEEE